MADQPTNRDRHNAEPVQSGYSETMDDAPVPSPLTPPPDAITKKGATTGGAAPTIAAVPDVPGYQILGELGHGGIGVVYKARQIALNRIVALKFVRSSEIRARDQARFQAEAEAVAALQHPNVAQIHEIGNIGGRPFLALEFCGGGSLTGRLQRDLLTPREAAKAVATLAHTIQDAHERGILHRDLKPDNVLLSGDGTLKITDFGLAKRFDPGSGQATPGITHAGTILGTPSYMAPEQTEGHADRLSDVYSLGAILYECLTGRPPFRGASTIDTMLAVTSQEPLPPSKLVSLPRELEAICLKCLEKIPLRRYESAGELAQDLERFLDGRPTMAQPLSALERTIKWAKRRPAVAALIGLGIVSLFALSGLSVRLWRAEKTATQARDRALGTLQIALGAVDDILEQEDLPGAGDPEMQRQAMLDSVSRSLEKLGQYSGDNPELITRSAKAFLRRGRLLVDTGRLDEAAIEYSKAVALCHEQLDLHDNDVLWRRELGSALNRLGGVHDRAGKVPEATASYIAAEDIRRKLVQENYQPDDEHDLAVTLYNRAGLIAEHSKNVAEAEQLFEESRQRLAHLVSQIPDAAKYKNSLAQNRYIFGRYLSLQDGRADGAINATDEARRLWQKLTDEFPLDTLYQTRLAWCNAGLARMYQLRNDPAAAFEYSTAAVASWREVVKRHPKVTTFQGMFGIACMRLGQVNIESQSMDQRVGLLEEAVQALTAAQNLPEYRAHAADAYLELARAYSRVGSQDSARSAFDQAIARYAELTKQNSGNSEYRDSLNRARKERSELSGGDA
jgi:tetratricopeptide (TPR) repeat protein/tRNA A-37 threonylcarbamoyl transferase component Bud32